VESQLRDPDSVLNSFRTFVRWRRGQAALRFGDIRFLDSPPATIAFVREYNGEQLLVLFNFQREPIRFPLPFAARAEVLNGHGLPSGRLHSGSATVPAGGVLFAAVEAT
jgi:alpha-glucosidase